MATRSIGTLTVDLIAKMGGFDEGMSKADRRMKRTADTIDKEAKRAAKALAAMGLAAVGATAALIKSQANEAEGYLRTARALDIKIEKLSAGTYAAKQLGIEGDKYADTLKDVSEKMGDFLATGAGPMADFFENIAPKVGVTADNFKALAADDALQLYVSSLEKANISQNEMTFYMEAIASDASLLAPLFKDNGEQMAFFSDQAERLGLVVDQKTAEGAEKLNRSLDQLKGSISGMGNDLLVTLNPQISEFSDLISNPKTLEGMKSLVGGVADLAGFMVKLATGTSSFIKSISEDAARLVHGVAFDDIDAITGKIEDINERIDQLRNGSGRGNATSKIHQLKEELKGLVALKESFERGQEKISASIENIGKKANDSIKPLERVNEQLKHGFTTLQRIKDIQNDDFGFDWSNESNDDPFAMPSDLGATNEKIAKSVEGIGVAYAEAGSIAGAAINGLASDTDDVLGGMERSLKQTLARMAQDAINNKILISISSETTGSNQDAEGASSAVGAGGWVGLVVVAIAALGKVRNKSEEEKWSKFTDEYRQGVQSTGTVLGRLDEKSLSLNNSIEQISKYNIDVLDVNYAMLGTLVDIREGISGVADGFAKTGFGDAGSAAFANIALGSRAKKAANFGEWEYLAQNTESAEFAGFLSEGNGIKSYLANQFGEEVFGFIGNAVDGIAKNVLRYETDLTDSGIEIFSASLASIIDGGVLEAQAYADVTRTKKFLGIDIKTTVETLTEGLSDVVVGQLTDVFVTSGEALLSAADVLGLDVGDKIGQLIIEGGRVSLKDLSVEELSAEIGALLSSTVDGWAEIFLGGTDVLLDFQKVGEGAFETMLRLSSQTASFADAAGRLNLNFSATGLDAVYQSQGVIDAAGGSDVLNSLLSSFTANFVTEAERFAFLETRLTSVFDSLGVEIPQTAEAYAALVREQESVTEAGQQQLVGLLSLSSVTREYIDALEDQSQSLDNAAELQETLNRGLDSWRNFLSEQDKILDDVANSTTGALADLRTAINSEIGDISKIHTGSLKAIDTEFDTKAGAIDKWLDAQLNHFQRRASVLSASISDLTSLSSSLDSAIKSLRVESFDINQQQFGAARDTLAGLASGVSAGGALPNADLISQLSGSLSGGQQFFDNFIEYDLAISHALSDLSQIESVTGAKLSDNEKLLAQLEIREENSQLRHDVLIDRNNEEREAAKAAQQAQHDIQVELLEQQYLQFEQSVNELHGINENTLTVESAINSLRQSIEAEQAERRRQENDTWDAMRDHLEEIAANTAADAQREREDYYSNYEESAA